MRVRWMARHRSWKARLVRNRSKTLDAIVMALAERGRADGVARGRVPRSLPPLRLGRSLKVLLSAIGLQGGAIPRSARPIRRAARENLSASLPAERSRRSSDCSPSEVAFSRAFKKMMGVPPSVWRHRARPAPRGPRLILAIARFALPHCGGRVFPRRSVNNLIIPGCQGASGADLNPLSRRSVADPPGN